MIPSKLCWLGLQGILVVFFLRFGSSAALGLAILLLVLPLGSLPINLYLRKKLHFSFCADTNLRKNQAGELRLKIENPTMFSAALLRCKICTENQLNRQRQRFSISTWIPAKRGQEVTLAIGSRYSGRLRISAPRAVLYDCFGLIGVRCKVDAVYHVTVQPDTFDLDIALNQTTSSLNESDVYSQDRPGMDLSETFQIREYVPGDSMRQVHWKLSNKLDRIIVRDPSLPVIQNVLIFWERTGESGDAQSLDAQAEVVVSLCKALLDRSIQFTVGWNDTDRNLCVLHEIRSMDELVGIIPRLMRATGVKEGVSGVELLLQSGAHALCAHMVYLAETPQRGVSELERYGNVTKMLCGDVSTGDAIVFNAKDYVQQLSQIEL